MKCRVRSQRKLDEARKRKVNELSPVSIVAMLTVCEQKFRFGYEKMRKAATEISYSFDSINTGYVNFEDLKDCLVESEGVDIPFDFKTMQKCDTIDDAERIAEYAQKAFACAVFCTVLTDKFLFKTVKAQQAVKQYCKMFDDLKQDRERLKNQRERLYAQYEILAY